MIFRETFEGFMVTKLKHWEDSMQKSEFKPRKSGDYDVDIKVEACGCCSGDLHAVDAWKTLQDPLCVGHEIVGTVVAIGPKVTKIAMGDRVGVGPQAYACLQCKVCKSGNENYCPDQVDTYGAAFPSTGEKTQGGYASFQRCHEHFVYQIPEALSSEIAAPLLCAGVTVYGPLSRNGVKAGSNVGIIGIGGLGHLALLYAKAMGANVWALSPSDRKKPEVEKLGEQSQSSIEYIDTSKKDWHESYKFHFDFLLNCADSNKGLDLAPYLSTLKVNQTLVYVGLANADDPVPNVHAFAFARNGSKLGGSHAGSRAETIEALQIAAEKGIKPWIETIPIGECVKGLQRLRSNEVRFRTVFVGYEKEFATS